MITYGGGVGHARRVSVDLRGAVAFATAASLAVCGCGSSRPAAPSAQDQQAAHALAMHESAWTHAYDRWDRAYRTGRQRAAFFPVVHSTYPTLVREGNRMYQSAIAVTDPGLRSQYLKLARNFLAQTTSAINLVDDAITRRNAGALRGAIGELDSSRQAELGLAEGFVSYFQRRYGFNPFAPGHG